MTPVIRPSAGAPPASANLLAATAALIRRRPRVGVLRPGPGRGGHAARCPVAGPPWRLRRRGERPRWRPGAPASVPRGRSRRRPPALASPDEGRARLHGSGFGSCRGPGGPPRPMIAAPRSSISPRLPGSGKPGDSPDALRNSKRRPRTASSVGEPDEAAPAGRCCGCCAGASEGARARTPRNRGAAAAAGRGTRRAPFTSGSIRPGGDARVGRWRDARSPPQRRGRHGPRHLRAVRGRAA